MATGSGGRSPGAYVMELVLKIGFWLGVVVLWILWGIAHDPTVKADRNKRKQEKLAMDFHTNLERGAPRDE
jgi:D-alanyl-lipoteichoic acid acyltransferase DltB (MBOAT superfamily)